MRVVIVSASVGGGHDGAARELAQRLRAAGRTVDLVDSLDLLPGRLGHLLCGLYRLQLTVAPRSWGWLLAALDTRPDAVARAVRPARRPPARGVLGPDVALAVSTYPMATQALARARARGRLRAPLVVHLTDPSVHRLSISPHAALTVAPTESRPARRAGSGPDATVVARRWSRRGSDPLTRAGRARPASGGIRPAGPPATRPRRVRLVGCRDSRADRGRHRRDRAGRARGRLRPQRGPACPARRVRPPPCLGWVDDMAELIRACDVVVQNAGGLTAAEALASEVPVLTYRCLPGHGRTNAAALDAEGLVPWIRSRGGLAQGLTCAGAAGTAVVVDPRGAELDAALAALLPAASAAVARPAC